MAFSTVRMPFPLEITIGRLDPGCAWGNAPMDSVA